MTYAMRLNGGELIRDGAGVRHDGFTVNVNAAGTGFGKAEPLVKTLNTLMTQGSWERISGFGNRAPALIVEVAGETPGGLNAGEVWLSNLMCPGTLEWLPRDQSVWTVFDVVSCYIDLTEDDGWDLDEARWIRTYRIPIKALPHARSQFLTITPAEPAGTIADVLVTDASTLDGFTGSWFSGGGFTASPRSGGTSSAEGSITPTVESGSVRVTYSMNKPPWALRLRYAFPTVFADATPYARVDVRMEGADAPITAIAETPRGNVVLSPARQALTKSPPGIAGALYFRLPTGTTALTVSATALATADEAFLETSQIRRVTRPPDLGTRRQKFSTITPGGSAPAQGSLHVSHPTVSLGRVLLHSFPLGRPSPALMQHRTASSDPIIDSTQVNGQRVPIQASNLVLTVPDLQLPTRGRAALWAKLRVDTGGATVKWTVTPKTDGFTVGEPQTRAVEVGPGAVVLVPLGLVTLSSTVTGSDGDVVVTLRQTDGDGTAFVDEVWAFGQDEDSALLVVDAGSGPPVSGNSSNHLWINAPTPEKPAGEVLIGTSLTDARWPATIQAGPEVHPFTREGVGILAVTCGTPDAATDFTHFMRWTHHAAKAGGEDS